MGVLKYEADGRVFWRVDEKLVQPDGRVVRFRKRRIPTKEQAMALAAKVKTESFEGRFFDRFAVPKLTVREVWEMYEPICKRDNDAWQTELGRARYVLSHLGDLKAAQLTVAHVDHYRNLRLGETTRTGKPPAPATLDREVELLKRCLNYAVRCGKLPANPIVAARLLRKPNTRRTVLDDEAFLRLYSAAEDPLKPILLVAYDTGMRRGEILKLRWAQVDLKSGAIRLAPQDTKSDQARLVLLTSRVIEALKRLPRGIHDASVFLNPKTGEGWEDIRKIFRNALKKAKLDGGIWFHDLRRSFVTNARRRGVPESVVMRMSGHRTRNVFDRYNIVSEDDLRDAIARIEQAQLKVGSSLGQSEGQSP